MIHKERVCILTEIAMLYYFMCFFFAQFETRRSRERLHMDIDDRIRKCAKKNMKRGVYSFFT